MEKLSVGQLKAASTITGNISVAWFTIGNISPLFGPISNLFDFFAKFIISLLFAVVFALISLEFVKGIKK